MKTNHDGTIILNAYDTWTACNTCGQRVTGDSIHTCSPQLKTLTDDEILDVEKRLRNNGDFCELHFARAILKKASEK